MLAPIEVTCDHFEAPLRHLPPQNGAMTSCVSCEGLSLFAPLRTHRKTATLTSESYEIVKTIIDVSLSLPLLISLLPMLTAIAIAVKLTSPGPIIFRQKRLTKNGEVFVMYKFRTMHVNAETETGAVWATDKDPRVTRLGRYLRCCRLDELPQLLNVILGHMSLIGPRPERPELARELAKKIPGFNRRLEVKAGITGLAQVSHEYASSIESYKAKTEYDIAYVDNRSLWLDFDISLKTLHVIITGAGAK